MNERKFQFSLLILSYYFVEYDKKGAKNFSKMLNILEQALFVGEVPEPDIVEQPADWCDQCVDKMGDG